MARPAEYLFDSEIKQLAKERAGYKCERCGKYDTALEIHHKIAIWFAQEVPCLAPAVISSIANTEVLCADCHLQAHKEESKEVYANQAPAILQAFLEECLHPTEPTWKEDLEGAYHEQRSQSVDQRSNKKVRKNRRRKRNKKRY